MALKFTLAFAEGACAPGLEEAHRLFKPGVQYSLKEIASAGLSVEAVMWLIITSIQREGKGLHIFASWAKRCAKETDIRARNCNSIEECAAVIRAATKAWAKGRPTSKGSREWAFSVLLDIIHSEE